MRLSFLIAFRYIFSKKRKTFINFLSYFSVASLSVGTAAMIIVLSVFNGLEETLKSFPNLKTIEKEQDKEQAHAQGKEQ